MRSPRLLAALVLAVPVLLFLLAGLADWLVWPRLFPVDAAGRAPAPTGLGAAQGFLEAASAWTALIVALFASARYATRRDPEALIVAAIMLATFPLELGHLLEGWLGEARGASPALASIWAVSSLFQASSLALGALMLTGRIRGPRALPRTVAAIVVLGTLALVLSLTALRGVDLASVLPGASPRPMEITATLLFAVSAAVYLRSRERRSSLLMQALLLMSLPLGLAQIQLALLGDSPYGAPALCANLQKLLAYSAALVGSLLDYFRMHQREILAGDERLSAVRRELAVEVQERRRIEKSRQTLQKAIETMSLGVTVIGLDATIEYVNRADAEMHGYEVGELLGRDARIYGGTDADGLSPLLMPSERGYWERESYNVTRDGTRFPVRLLSDVVRSENGEPLGLVTICEDLREKRRLRERLEEADVILDAMRFAADQFLTAPDWEESVESVLARLGTATQATGAYIAALEDPPRPARASIRYYVESPSDQVLDEERVRERTALRASLGALWEPHLAQGRIHVASMAEGSEEERRVLERLGVESCTLVPLFVDSSWWGYLGLEAPARPRPWGRSGIEALTTAARTFEAAIQRQLVQQRLQASEERYRETVDGARETIASIGADGRFDWVNRAWRTLLGFAPEEKIEATWREVVSESGQPAFEEALERVLSGQHVESLQTIFVDTAGREIPVEGDLAPRMAGGRPVGAHGFFRDVTERRAVEKMKEDLLATVSHELRTPLTSIVASLDLIANKEFQAGSPERVKELITLANRNSNRLLVLINDFLDLQKLKAKQMKFRLEPVEVVPLIEQAISEIRTFADSRDLEIELLERPDDARVLADRQRLLQILNNLLSNAIKYSTEDSRKVSIGISEHDAAMRISVIDEGPGIAQEFLDRLFDEFTQADSSRTRKSGGSGLGLHIVRQLAEGMNGTVSVDSRVGVGSAFHVDLPKAPGA